MPSHGLSKRIKKQKNQKQTFNLTIRNYEKTEILRDTEILVSQSLERWVPFTVFPWLPLKNW